MSSISRIVICGQSIFIMAIEAGLAQLTELEVVRLNPHLPAVLERISTLQPDLVLIEHYQGYGDLALDILNRGLPLVILNGQKEQGILLTGRAVSASDLTELVSPQKSSAI